MSPAHREGTRIACVLPNSRAYTRGVIRGVIRFSRERFDWRVRLFEPSPPYFGWIRQYEPSGVIALVSSDEVRRFLSGLRVPTVNVSGTMLELPFPSVIVDNVAVGRLAAQHFLERAMPHMAFAAEADTRYAREREQGFAEVLREAGRSFTRLWAPTAPPPECRGRQHNPQWSTWLRELPKPAGVLAVHDGVGAVLTEICGREGLSVPDQVAVVGVDNDDLTCEMSDPPLSSVVTPGENVGLEAAALLERLMQGEEWVGRGSSRRARRKPLVTVPPVRLVVRRSSDVMVTADEEVAAALRYVREHNSKAVRVGDLAAHVGLNRRSLELRFRRALGRSPRAEIERARVERVRHLLGGDWPIKRIALSTGFRSPERLAVVFRRVTGQTPTAYRRQLRGGAR